LGTALWLGEARANLAEDLIALGHTADADALLAEAAAGLGDLAFHTVHAMTLRAELQLAAGDARAAAATARGAMALAPALRVWVEDARRVEGEALALIEGPDAGLAVLAAAETAGATIGAAPVRWRAALAQSRLLAEIGRSAESRAAAARALIALEATASEIEDPALRRSFEASAPMARARASVTGT
jgi:hypothetical protein